MRLSMSTSDVSEECTMDPMYSGSYVYYYYCYYYCYYVKLKKPGYSPPGPDTVNGVVTPPS